ncbi:MAG: hypothetical protein JW751_04290 [Polyangiaceae bacterium]|nr:hypothetical protein [Polyangiaceae bacterium]
MSTGSNTAFVVQVEHEGSSWELEGHQGRIWSVGFSPDGSLLVSGSSDRTVRLWRVRDGAALRTLDGHQGSVMSVAFSPDGSLLASSSPDGTVRYWRVSDGSLLLLTRAIAGTDAGLVLTSTGHFDLVGSNPAEAARQISCRIGPRWYPVELCVGRFLVPGLLAKILVDVSVLVPPPGVGAPPAR